MCEKFLRNACLVIAALLVLSVNSCSKQDTPKGDSISVDVASLEFAAKDDSARVVTVIASGEWTAVAADTTWVKVDTLGKDKVAISVLDNTGAARTSSVVFSCGAKKAEVAISQAERVWPLKKVSVIGDSISTWKGYVPSGYSCHYPASSGTEPPTKVEQSYWYMLATKLMRNGKFEKNIAYSGTGLTETPESTFNTWYASHSTSKTDWYRNDFIRRYYAQGLGEPDVVLIHGGTNDWNHNCDKLVNNEKIRSTSAPNATNMKNAFARADKATTFEQAKALNGGTFVDSYCKLIKMIVCKNPNVKIVCIVPTYCGRGVENAIKQVAEHYSANCRCVDLFAVNGFQDLGVWDYPESSLPKNPTQPHFPTHDFNPSNGHGAHPSITGMKNIAEKIYNECGDWLDD